MFLTILVTMKKLTKVGKTRLINKMILDEFMSVNSKYFHEIQKFPHFRHDGIIYKKGQHGETFYYSVSYDIDKKKIYNNHYVSLGGSIQIEVCNENISSKTGYITIEFTREFEFKKSFFGGKNGTDKQYISYDVRNVINNKYNGNPGFNSMRYKYSVPLNPIIDPIDKKLFDEIKKIRLIRTKIIKNFDKIYKKQEQIRLKKIEEELKKEQKIVNDKLSIMNDIDLLF